LGMKESVNWMLDFIKNSNTSGMTMLFKMWSSLEFGAEDIKELKLRVVMKQVLKECTQHADVINACNEFGAALKGMVGTHLKFVIMPLFFNSSESKRSRDSKAKGGGRAEGRG